ncbi:MAG: DUF6785 family protein [Armatimonadota bacterium]
MGISLKAFILGIIAVVITCLIISIAELVVHGIPIGALQMPPVAVGLLIFIIGLNAISRRVAKRFSLNAQELLTIYCMMIFSAMISSRAFLQRVIPLLATPPFFSDDTNNWIDLYYPYIKKWLVPFNPDPSIKDPQFVSQRFFEGLKQGESIPWDLWIGPLFYWAVFALLVFGIFLCMASILRKQWVENEKLSFPLAQLPLAMVEDADQKVGFFKNKVTWIGFLIPVIVYTINGLHNVYPTVPEISLFIRLDHYIQNPPWNAIGYTVTFFSYAALGFFFLLPTEILFSLWFFLIFVKLQAVLFAVLNFEPRGMGMYATSQYVGYQMMGAFFILTAYMLYTAKPHLKTVIRSAFGLEKVDDSKEALSNRTAVFGLILCFLGASLWLKSAGMSAWVAMTFLAIFVFIISFVMARSVAEGGMLMTESAFRPLDVYKMFAPASTLGPGNLTTSALIDTTLFVELRNILLTAFLDAFKIGDSVKINLRKFVPILFVSIILAMIIGAIFQIWLPYDRGASNLYWYSYGFSNTIGLRDYESVLRGTDQPVGLTGITFFLIGATFTAFLAYMRYCFFWWPFHPLGYAISASWTMLVFWFPCMIAWAIKVVIMKYGGMKLYIRVRPFFLGLIMSEFCMAIIWTLISYFTDIRAPGFPWP